MELSELLKEAVSHIQGTYQAVELPEADKGKEIETIPATPDVKNFSYTVVDGNVYFRENSLMCYMVEIRCLHTKLVRARPSRWLHRLWRVNGLD